MTLGQADSLIGIAIILVLVVAGGYDVYASTMLGGDLTVSARLQEWSRAYPILPLAVGTLLGHLFWTRGR
jgi:hypothetical protein